ncbi:hypothetical protein F2Q70_00027472 [Brassica cretica]|uniref:Uncharacterized protein n=1 Tax=Brassica cretica TaxID=69181 RepID=A0A8S9LEX9_BRACR|nr:hypothetical protein F2Q70_00027472 [Brassica cretica]
MWFLPRASGSHCLGVPGKESDCLSGLLKPDSLGNRSTAFVLRFIHLCSSLRAGSVEVRVLCMADPFLCF